MGGRNTVQGERISLTFRHVVAPLSEQDAAAWRATMSEKGKWVMDKDNEDNVDKESPSPGATLFSQTCPRSIMSMSTVGLNGLLLGSGVTLAVLHFCRDAFTICTKSSPKPGITTTCR